MTVSELIRELQAMPPQLPVRVLLSGVWIGDESGYHEIELIELDAIEADMVRHCGPYVLIESK